MVSQFVLKIRFVTRLVFCLKISMRLKMELVFVFIILLLFWYTTIDEQLQATLLCILPRLWYIIPYLTLKRVYLGALGYVVFA